MHRPRTFALKHRKGAGQHLRQVRGVEQRMAEARDTGHQLLLARQFMQASLTATERIAPVDAGDHEHGNGVGEGLAHGSGDIGHTGPADDQAHPRTPLARA